MQHDHHQFVKAQQRDIESFNALNNRIFSGRFQVSIIPHDLWRKCPVKSYSKHSWLYFVQSYFQVCIVCKGNCPGCKSGTLGFAQAGHKAALGGLDLATQHTKDVRQSGTEVELILFLVTLGGKNWKRCLACCKDMQDMHTGSTHSCSCLHYE